VTLTNNSAAPAPVKLSLAAPNRVDISSVSAPATGTSRGFTWNGTLTPALPPTITSVTPGATPAGGYLPLSAFGIAPIAGMGDETIVNYNVPPFTYGTETYTPRRRRLQRVRRHRRRNGPGRRLPQPADPLDHAAEQHHRAVLERPEPRCERRRPHRIVDPTGTTTWLVVDYAAVPTYSQGLANTFQVWIETGAGEDVTIAHEAMAGVGVDGLSQGAENRDGTSGAAYSGGSNTAWVVNATGPTPGGSVQITYDASSSRAGSYVLAPTATSPLVKGTISVPADASSQVTGWGWAPCPPPPRVRSEPARVRASCPPPPAGGGG
jgi:hypothetical protein